MDDQAGIVRLTVVSIAICVGIVLIGLSAIAIHSDGEVANSIVDTFQTIAVSCTAALAMILSSYVIVHRPTTASVAQQALSTQQSAVSVTASPSSISVIPTLPLVPVAPPEASEGAQA